MTRKNCSTFLSLISYLLPVIFLTVANPQPGKGADAAPGVLQGFAEQHSDRMAPVEPQFQVGAVFNQEAVPQLEPNNEWYWIPSWYAGQKHADTATVLQDYNFQTGQSVQSNRVITNRQDLSIGFQPDRNGQIWEFKRAPYTAIVEGDGFFTTMMVRNRDPIKVTEDCVIIRLVQTSVNVDKRSRRILKTLQEEQINTYTPGTAGSMNLQASLKTFGADGMPQLQELSCRVVKNAGSFKPIDIYQGRDMRMLFRNFLLTHGYASYLPDNLKPENPGTEPQSSQN